MVKVGIVQDEQECKGFIDDNSSGISVEMRGEVFGCFAAILVSSCNKALICLGLIDVVLKPSNVCIKSVKMNSGLRGTLIFWC